MSKNKTALMNHYKSFFNELTRSLDYVIDNENFYHNWSNEDKNSLFYKTSNTPMCCFQERAFKGINVILTQNELWKKTITDRNQEYKNEKPIGDDDLDLRFWTPKKLEEFALKNKNFDKTIQYYQLSDYSKEIFDNAKEKSFLNLF